jgi:hypothetical protein
MSQTIIVHCKDSVGTPACCTAELSSLPPLGLKSAALCFQSSTVAGDAACSMNGTAYPQTGTAFALPAPVKAVYPVPAVISLGDTPPKDCGCHNGTHPLGPAGPTGPIIPPAGPTTPVTPISPVVPPTYPIGPPPVYPTGTMASPPKQSSKTTLASGWNPKPTPTPTGASTSPVKPTYTNGGSHKTVSGLVLAIGFAAFWL